MDGNEKFSEYTESQKKELLEYLKNYKIELRDNLNLNKKIKFGIEIEAESDKLRKLLTDNFYRKENLNSKILMHYEEYFKEAESQIYNYETCPWILKSDITVKKGAEIHSPILKDTKKTWTELKEICEFLKSLDAVSTESTATHVHFNEESFLEDVYDLYNLIKLYSAYENVLYLFGTGEFTNFRDRIHSYASPVANDFHNVFHGICFRTLDYHKILKKINFSHSRGLRLNNLRQQYTAKDTFEFRFANGTLSPAIIQNLVNAEGKMCSYAVSSNFDDDFVTRKFNYMKFPKTTRELATQYLNTPLNDILEFVDLIFDNTLDKLYFIRQCIKEPIPKKEKGLQKAKKFY